jgi:hypothetical protein
MMTDENKQPVPDNDTTSVRNYPYRLPAFSDTVRASWGHSTAGTAQIGLKKEKLVFLTATLFASLLAAWHDQISY